MDRSDSTRSRGDNDQRTSTRGNDNASTRGSDSDRSISTGGNNKPRQTSSSSDTDDSGNDRRPTSTTEGSNRPTQTSATRTSNDYNESTSTSDNEDRRTSSSTSNSSSTSADASPTSQSSSTNGVPDGRSSTSSNDQSRTSGSSSSSGSSNGPTSTSSQGPTNSSTNSSSSSSDSSSSSSSTNSSNRSTVSSSYTDGPTSTPNGAITSSSSGINTATSTDVFVTTIDGHAVTSTRKSVFTSTPDAGDRSANKNDGDDGYWHDGGAVGGTFAAVGIVVVALIIGLGWLLYRRRKSKRMDADVMAAASAAAATTRTPFDDDDDDDIMGGPFGTPGGGNGSVDQNSGLHGSVGRPSLEANGLQGAQPLYQPSSGYHQPAHYVNSVDDPYGTVQELGVPVSTGAALGGLRQPTAQYYSPGRAGSNDAQRGLYESLPTDSAFAYQRPSMESSAYRGVGSSAYAYAQPDPFRDSTEAEPAAAASNLQYHPSVSGQSNASGQPSSSAEYEPAQSNVSHMYMPHVPEDAPYPVSYNNAAAPATGAAAPVSGEVTAWPSFIPGVAPTHNENYARETEPSTTHYVSDMSGHNAGVVQAFGGDNEGQSAMDHGDWDPPALSSAWFPTSVNDQKQASSPSEPVMQSSEMPSSSLPPYPSNENTAPWPTDEKAAVTRPPGSTPPATGHQPLMVRNPSPEDE